MLLLQIESFTFRNYINFIVFYEDAYDDTDRFTMLYTGCGNTSDRVIESCICFYVDYIKCCVYYTATGDKWCENSRNLSEFMRLLDAEV